MVSNPITLILRSEEDTKLFAELLAQINIKGSVWLAGDLGAGKTTLTRFWLRALGHDGAVKSPTYTLVEPYDLSKINKLSDLQRVYHADLYRLQDPEELSFIGFEEYLEDSNALVIIEWASRAIEYLPKPEMQINISVSESGGEQIREVIITYASELNIEPDYFDKLSK